MMVAYLYGIMWDSEQNFSSANLSFFGQKKCENFFLIHTVCYSQLSHECPTKGKILDENLKKMADGVGFEPTERSHVRRFSRPVPSTARPPIRPMNEVQKDNAEVKVCSKFLH